MPRRQPQPPLAVFAVASLAMHAGVFVGAWHRSATAGSAAPSFENGAPALVGETLDVDEATQEEAEAEEAEETERGEQAPADDVGGRRTPHPSASDRSARATPRGATSAEAHPAPALFGAVGVRYATDLATTFTRAFPQAASSDAIWNAAPLGSAGVADLTLVLDDEGHLVSHVVGGSPSPALRRGIEHTLLLLGSRAFTARGATTRLRVTARVTRDVVHDGLHGDVYALSGGSFSGDLGTAFFALPGAGGPGRRIDLELHLLP